MLQQLRSRIAPKRRYAAMDDPLPKPRSVRQKLYRSPVLWVFLVTLIVLAVHPIPECIDCEFPRPWGRDDVAYHHAANILSVWFVVATITAGAFSIRKYWLVPISIAVADVITQPIGGVALWSLWNNEGPAILLLGCAWGAVGLSAGAVVRFLIDRVIRAVS
jgi:hypothetical protein